MNCSEIQARLSAYHDNELSPDEAALVATHLTSCATCTADLASFQQLSSLSQRLTDPPVPPQIWSELQAQLDQPTDVAAGPQDKATLFPARFLAIAASILVAIGIGTMGYKLWTSRHAHEDRHLAINFAHYLEGFEESPEKAQQILLANYQGRPTTLAEATNTLGYEPLAAKRLPPDYSVDKTYLLKMPCCTCAQVLCRNKAGQAIAIFEHDIDQPVWFGDRASVEHLCHNIPTSVVQVSERLAATWQEGRRFVTIIGATNLDEVTAFVGHFREPESIQ